MSGRGFRVICGSFYGDSIPMPPPGHPDHPVGAEVQFDTFDGSEIRRSPGEVGSSSHYLQGFIHPRWCRMSSINSIKTEKSIYFLDLPPHSGCNLGK